MIRDGERSMQDLLHKSDEDVSDPRYCCDRVIIKKTEIFIGQSMEVWSNA